MLAKMSKSKNKSFKMRYHKHKGNIKSSHLIKQKHKDKQTIQYHNLSLSKNPMRVINGKENIIEKLQYNIDKKQFINKINGIDELRKIFLDNNWNLDEHYRIYLTVCRFINQNYKKWNKS